MTLFFACGIVSGHLAAHIVEDDDRPARDQARDLLADLPRFDGSAAARLEPAYAF